MCAAVESAVQPQILEKDVEKANIATANSCNALAPAGEQQSEATHGASEPSSDISQSEGRTDEALAVQEQPLKSNSNDQNHLGAPPSNPAGVEASASPVPSPPRVQSSITVSDTRRPRASAEALPQSGDGEAVCTTQQLADAKQREQTLQRTIRLLEKELANFRRIRPLVVEVPRCVKHPEGFIVYEITVDRGVVNYSVRHRYSEFRALHNSSQKECPHICLPHFPGRKLIGSTNAESKFVEQRRFELDVYMKQYAAVEALRDCRSMEKFLAPTSSIGEDEDALVMRSGRHLVASSAPLPQRVSESSFRSVRVD